MADLDVLETFYGRELSFFRPETFWFQLRPVTAAEAPPIQYFTL